MYISSATPTQQAFLSPFWHLLPFPTTTRPSHCDPTPKHPASFIFHLEYQLPHYDYPPLEPSIPQEEILNSALLSCSSFMAALSLSGPGLAPPVSYFSPPEQLC